MFKQRYIKFILSGGLATAVNLISIYLFVESLGFNTFLLRNIANILAIELSLVFSFFLYRIWIWRGGQWMVKDVLLRQIPLYHIFSGVVILLRILIVFPLLDYLQVNYLVNTILGALTSVFVNYLIRDRWVFSTPNQSQEQQLHGKASYYPEGFAPALSYLPSVPDTQRSRQQRKITLLSIVMPAYNEEECIIDTIQDIIQNLQDSPICYEILVVNDHSQDQTESILQSLKQQYSQVNYINNYYPNGFGFAIRCGLENFQGDAVVIAMADNSDSPQNIIDYYHKLEEGYDCVFGSRFIKGGGVIDYPKHKLVVNRLSNFFVLAIFGLPYNDVTNAFKAYHKDVIQGISPLISHHFNLTVEIPLKAIIRGYSYTIIPITWRNRAKGISKLKLKEMGSRYLFIVLYVWLEKHLSRGDYVKKNSMKFDS